MSAESKFVELVRGWLCSLPHDLKVAYEAMDDEDLPRSARELAVGAIIYVVSPNDFIVDRNDAVVSYADDALLLRIALCEVVASIGKDAGDKPAGDKPAGDKPAGEVAALLRARFEEQFADVTADLALCGEVMGELYPWLASKVAGLRALEYKGKKLAVYLDDDEARELLFQDGLVFGTDYPVDEDTIADKIKKASTITDVMKRRRAEELRLTA